MTLAAFLQIFLGALATALFKGVQNAIIDALNRPSVVLGPSTASPLNNHGVSGPSILNKWGRV